MLHSSFFLKLLLSVYCLPLLVKCVLQTLSRKEVSTGSLEIRYRVKLIACFVIGGAEGRSLNTQWPFLSSLLRWFNRFGDGLPTARLGKPGLWALCSINQRPRTVHSSLPSWRKLVMRVDFLGQFWNMLWTAVAQTWLVMINVESP